MGWIGWFSRQIRSFIAVFGEASELMDHYRKLARATTDLRDTPTGSQGHCAALSSALVSELIGQGFSHVEAASGALALATRSKGDLVITAEGIRLSAAAHERLRASRIYEYGDGGLWVGDGTPPDSSQGRLLGNVNSTDYAIALCKLLGLDAGRLLVGRDGDVGVQLSEQHKRSKS